MSSIFEAVVGQISNHDSMSDYTEIINCSIQHSHWTVCTGYIFIPLQVK